MLQLMGRLKINGNEYQALVFEAENTIRLSVLEKALELAKVEVLCCFMENCQLHPQKTDETMMKSYSIAQENSKYIFTEN